MRRQVSPPVRLCRNRSMPAAAAPPSQNQILSSAGAIRLPYLKNACARALDFSACARRGFFGPASSAPLHFGKEAMSTPVAPFGQPWVERHYGRRRMVRLGTLRDHIENGGLAAAAWPREAENDTGSASFGLDQCTEEARDEILAQQPVVPLGFDRPLDVLIH